MRARSSVLFHPLSPPQKETLPPHHVLVCTLEVTGGDASLANVTTNSHTLGGVEIKANLFASLIDLWRGGGVGPTPLGLALLVLLQLFCGCFSDGGTQLEIVD